MQHFVQKCNRKFLEAARKQRTELQALKTMPRIAKLVRARLQLTAEHIGTVATSPLNRRAAYAVLSWRGQLASVRQAVLKSCPCLLGPVHADTWPQAMAVQAAPANLPKALATHYALMDDIWHLAGDQSADSSWCARPLHTAPLWPRAAVPESRVIFLQSAAPAGLRLPCCLHVLTVAPSARYSKRVLLSGVYSATEVYMLTDYSPGLADTWQALDRRLEEVARLGKLAAQVGTCCCSLPASTVLVLSCCTCLGWLTPGRR